MKNNTVRGLTGIEIVVATALTMIACAVITPIVSAKSQTAKPVVQQTSFLYARPTRYQTENVDEGILSAASASPEVSNSILMAARKQALISAGIIRPDSERCMT